MAGCLCPAPSADAPRPGGNYNPPIPSSGVCWGPKPQREDEVLPRGCCSSSRGAVHRTEQELLCSGEERLRCLRAIRAAPLQYKYRRFNKTRVIRCLQVTTVGWYQHEQRIRLITIVVLAVRRMWRWWDVFQSVGLQAKARNLYLLIG